MNDLRVKARDMRMRSESPMLMPGFKPLSEPRKRKPLSVGLERLRTLYSILVGVPDEKVRLNSWVCGLEDVSAIANPARAVVNRCGTTACAGGWAGAYPEFIAAGLRLNGWGSPVYQDESGAEALALFFGMSCNDARSVFDGHAFGAYTTDLTSVYEHTPRRVALNRIREYLYEQGAITPKRNAEMRRFEEQF